VFVLVSAYLQYQFSRRPVYLTVSSVCYFILWPVLLYYHRAVFRLSEFRSYRMQYLLLTWCWNACFIGISVKNLFDVDQGFLSFL